MFAQVAATARESIVLRYTRHPFVDVGAATITAYVGKRRPEDVDRRDLDEVADFLRRNYTKDPLKSFLTAIFPNAGYVQPAMRPEKLQAFFDRYLYGYRNEESLPGKHCVYCMREASVQVYRQHVPMLTGEGLLNFFPEAVPGLPVCGYCLLCIQAFPLGATKSAGRALIIHSDDEKVILIAARNFLADNQRYLQMRNVTKYPDQKFPRTIFVDQVLKISNEHLQGRDRSPSITLYHLTNYGTTADVDILHLPTQIVDFLVVANSARFGHLWREIVRRAWQQVDGARPGVARNFLYEDLLDLPERARRFVQIYFLRRGFNAPRAFKDDPRRGYSLGRELDLVSWDLTAVFLREVVGMERDRIKVVRDLGDKLGSYISKTNNRKFFGDFYRSDRYGELRGLLIKASNAEIRKGNLPLIGFDEFIVIFEEGEDLARIDWRLARDLVLIRMIERLHEDGWMVANKEAVPEDGPDEQAIGS